MMQTVDCDIYLYVDDSCLVYTGNDMEANCLTVYVIG